MKEVFKGISIMLVRFVVQATYVWLSGHLFLGDRFGECWTPYQSK
jgi:hypothetical protein